MLFRQIFDEKLAQYAYLIGCQRTNEALLIDPQRDIDRYLALAEKEGLAIVAVADTHIHADYLTGLREFAERGVMVYASDEGESDWKYEWLQAENDYACRLLRDGDTFTIGHIEITAIHTPGHTPEHLSYLITDRGGGADRPIGLASGDFVFVGDLGRPDLLESAAGLTGTMEPSARTLYRSVGRLNEIEEFVQLWPAHGAGSACGKALGSVPMSTVGYEKRYNASIRAARDGEDAFVRFILDGQPEPPMYFARMKRDNRSGPPVLGSLPQPGALSVDDLRALAGRSDIAVLDTRPDRSAFMAAHLPGSLFVPFDKGFSTVAGSFVTEEMPVYLIMDEADVTEAVRDLVRIGIDRIEGYASPEILAAYADAGGPMVAIQEVTFDHLSDLRGRKDVAILDVRGAAEFATGHVEGATNIAYTRLIPRNNDIPGGKTLAVHCKAGGRAAFASAFLARRGYPVIYINGSFDDWACEQQNAPAVSAVQ